MANLQPPANGESTSDNTIRDLAAAIVVAMRQPKQLTESQQKVELKFRLIRNGLGNYGGHGDDPGDRALIAMEKTANQTGGGSVVRFHGTLPSRAHWAVAVVYSLGAEGGSVVHRLQLDGDRTQIQVPATDITRVEILDEFGVPIAAGVPVKVPVATSAKTAASTK